jgi:hypothetical protein
MDSDFADPAALRAGASLRVINPGVFALEVTREIDDMQGAWREV